MSPSPHDRGECPLCKADIDGRTLLVNKVKPQEEFSCPDCGNVLTYSLIKQFPDTKIMVHNVSDLEDTGQIKLRPVTDRKPVPLKKPVKVISARAYIKESMRSNKGTVLPERCPVIILNVHMTGSTTEVVPEDISIVASSLPIKVPKSNLLLSSEEVDSELAFRILGIPKEAQVTQFISPTFGEEVGANEG